MLSGKKPPVPDEIARNCRYILEVYRKTEILEWCLLTLYQDKSISLLPGEGISIELPSYCLDQHAASPDANEFFPWNSLRKKREWLLPLLDYAANHADEDLPVQSLILNMQQSVPYEELPEEQQDLLDLIFPDAGERFGGKNPAKELLGAIITEALEKVKIAVEIIDDAEEIASERGAEVVEIIQNYNEKGLDGVVEYTENRLFDASLDVFKSFHEGNPEVERAFEMFRAYNKDLMTTQDDTFERLAKEAKKFWASRWKYMPERKDVQPIAARGGY